MRSAFGLLLLLLLPWDLQGSPGIRAILVFPFENQSPRSDLTWISEGLAEILSTCLAGPQAYVLGREERNAAYLQLGLPPGTPLTLASAYKVAEILGTDWAVVGSFDVTGDRLTARAQLLEVRQLRLAPRIEVTGELPELVDLETRLAWRLLAAHDPTFTVGEEEDFRRRFPEVRLDAFENYIRGLLAADDQSRMRFLLEADRLNPADHRAAFELGRAYFDQKDYASSAKWFRKLGEADANYLESLFLLGVDEFFLGHREAAQKAFETLARQIPLSEVSNNLGVLKAGRKQYLEALADFERAYQGDPTDPDFCFNRGVCLWYLQRYEAAAKSLEETLRGSEEDSEAHILLAMVEAKLGDAAGERHELQWLAEHEVGPATDGLGDVVPQTRLKKNYDGRAFRLLSVTLQNALEERLSSVPAAEHAAIHLGRGQKFLAEGRLPEAEHELTEAVSLLPGSSEAHLALAQVMEAKGRHREAAAELETSLKLKNSLVARLCLARVYLSLGQPEAARDQSQAALSLDPGNPEAQQLVDQIRARAAPLKRAP
jgi:tetratricopeptide (TPR) repeat protein